MARQVVPMWVSEKPQIYKEENRKRAGDLNSIVVAAVINSIMVFYKSSGAQVMKIFVLEVKSGEL